jgi:hypothetical protein
MTEEDIKRVNDAYARKGIEDDYIEDIATTFKELIALLCVVAGLTMLAFAIWGK